MRGGRYPSNVTRRMTAMPNRDNAQLGVIRMTAMLNRKR